MTKKTILHPQEIETFYVIPALRKQLALQLKADGLKQKDIAELLGINSATISQYRSQKRGSQIKFPLCMIKEIKISAKKIKDRFTYLQQTQHLLNIIREKNMLCLIHQQFSDIPQNCNPKDIGCYKSYPFCTT
ncbi:helix-turn-helix domain-containing protein [Candidatus Woesearchaeota archaeon]|nr:helix-turn-helix domain-containing protein [Candidatus Woesearchaeota archaeon]